jgi:hypothetical protein
VGWYKFLGAPPGLAMACESGCPDPAVVNGTAPTSIAVNGAVQAPWTSTHGPTLDNRILQSSWSIVADKSISSYDFSISNVVATAGTTSCHVEFTGELGAYFVKGQWSGIKTFSPGEKINLDMVYLCTPINGVTKDTFSIRIHFTNYKSIVMTWTKLSIYSPFIFIGSGEGNPQAEENVNAQGTPQKAWKTPSEGCIDPNLNNRRTDCTLDERGAETRKFYITYHDSLDAPGNAVIPAPPTTLDPSKQFPGVHSSYFFTYNSTDMVGCSPYWDVEQKGLITDKFDFVKQGKATVGLKTPPFILTINYNCSTQFTKCSKPGQCASLFTGFIPINSIGCDPSKPSDVTPCSYPMFRWIKTVAPIQPVLDSMSVEWHPFPFGGNISWLVPDSGDGADLFANQRIRLYNITMQNIDTKEKRQYLEYVNGTFCWWCCFVVLLFCCVVVLLVVLFCWWCCFVGVV